MFCSENEDCPERFVSIGKTLQGIHTFKAVVGQCVILKRKGRYILSIALIISIISVAFSVFFGFISFAFNFKNNKRTDTKDFEERVKENTRINMKLDTITSNTTEIKNEVSEMRKEINSHDTRIIKVEESVKSAHHRLNTLEERLNTNKLEG